MHQKHNPHWFRRTHSLLTTELCCRSRTLLWHQLLQYLVGHEQNKIQQKVVAGSYSTRPNPNKLGSLARAFRLGTLQQLPSLGRPYCSDHTQNREPRVLAWCLKSSVCQAGIKRELHTKTRNVYEQWKASGSSCNFSYSVLSCILTQICLYFRHDLCINSSGISLNPDLQHLLPHFSSCQQRVPISCKIHTITEGSEEWWGAVPLLTPRHTYAPRFSTSRGEPRIGSASPHTDFCSLERCSSPNLRLTNTWMEVCRCHERAVSKYAAYRDLPHFMFAYIAHFHSHC